MNDATATAEPATVPVQTATAETVTGAQLLGDLPPVNERAVAAAGGTPTPTAKPETTPTPDGQIDKAGRVFDAKRYRTNPDGTPFRNRKGLFMPRGGRKPKNAAAVPATTPEETGSAVPADLPRSVAGEPSSPSQAETAAPNQTAQPAQAVPVETYELSAESRLRIGYAVADYVFAGDGEWNPDDNAEHEALKKCYVAWQRSRGSTPATPGMAFLEVALGYAFKRLFRTNTAKRLAKWFPWAAPYLGVEPPQPEKPKEPEKPAQKAPAPQPIISTSIA